MKRILLAYDGSEPSRSAAKLAATVARRFGASLSIVYVGPPSGGPGLEEGAWLLDELAGQLRAEGIEVETVLRQGDPGKEIVDAARLFEVELVVVGTRGRNPAARVLLGSVADFLVHHAPVPVLVAR